MKRKLKTVSNTTVRYRHKTASELKMFRKQNAYDLVPVLAKYIRKNYCLQIIFVDLIYNLLFNFRLSSVSVSAATWWHGPSISWLPIFSTFPTVLPLSSCSPGLGRPLVSCIGSYLIRPTLSTWKLSPSQRNSCWWRQRWAAAASWQPARSCRPVFSCCSW